MKQSVRDSLFAFVALVLFASGGALAGEWLSGQEVQDLLSGNTVEGSYMTEVESRSAMKVQK